MSNEDASLFVQLAQAYRDAGDYDRAFRILRRGIEQHPNYAAGYELLGRTLLDRGRVAEAAFCFERLLEMEPSNGAARGALDEIARRLREAPTRVGMAVQTPAAPAGESVPPVPPPSPASLSAPAVWPPNPIEPSAYTAPQVPPPPPAVVVPPPENAMTATPRPLPPQTPFLPPPVIPPATMQPGAAAHLPGNRIGEDPGAWEPESPVRNGSATPAKIRTASEAVTQELKALEESLKQVEAQAQRGTEVSPTQGIVDATAVALSDMLVGLVEYRDPFFRGNTSLTRLVANAMARELGLPDEIVNAVALGAVLRDLGQFPLRSVLNRPGLELPAGARKNMERHVDAALDMLTGIELPEITRDTIRYHHERWDGAGYPDGLKGDAIPLGARIVAVADSFSAMLSARPHRLPKRVPAAIEDLRTAAGTQYDPAVVDALIRVVNASNWKGPGFSLRHHILIVDPDETRAMVLATRLCSHGYLAEAAFGVATAQERLERSHMVALIISSDMPGADEATLLRAVRETARIAMIPVIMTDTGVSERVPLLEAGADVCLNRGSSFEELKATLEAFLRREGRSVPQAGSRSPEVGWSRLRGDVHDFPLNWLMQVLHYDSRTAAIFIVGENDEGVIYLDRGSPRHAQTRYLAGEEAFRTMLRWKTGSFSVDPDARTETQTIRLTLMNLLLDTAVEEDHASFFGQVQT